MKTRLMAVVAVAAAATLSTAAQASATPTGSDMLYGSVSDLADKLNTLTWPNTDGLPSPNQWDYNFYPDAKGKPDVATNVVWGTPNDATTYLNEAKCAALVTAALEHTFSSSWATELYLQQQFLPNPPVTAIPGLSPTAADYYNGFVAQHGAGHFSAKSKVADLLPGDVIAIKYPPGLPETGHMMIVAQAPSQTSNAGEWAVQVIDSTSNPHGVASTAQNSRYLAYPDTRAKGVREFSGIGRGWIMIDTDSAGLPIDYRWGANESATYPMSERPMVFEAIL